MIALFEGAVWEEARVIYKVRVLKMPSGETVHPEGLCYDTDFNDLLRAWKKAHNYLRVTVGWGLIEEMKLALINSDLYTAHNVLVRAVEYVQERISPVNA